METRKRKLKARFTNEALGLLGQDSNETAERINQDIIYNCVKGEAISFLDKLLENTEEYIVLGFEDGSGANVAVNLRFNRILGDVKFPVYVQKITRIIKDILQGTVGSTANIAEIRFRIESNLKALYAGIKSETFNTREFFGMEKEEEKVLSRADKMIQELRNKVKNFSLFDDAPIYISRDYAKNHIWAPYLPMETKEHKDFEYMRNIMMSGLGVPKTFINNYPISSIETC